MAYQSESEGARKPDRFCHRCAASDWIHDRAAVRNVIKAMTHWKLVLLASAVQTSLMYCTAPAASTRRAQVDEVCAMLRFPKAAECIDV